MLVRARISPSAETLPRSGGNRVASMRRVSGSEMVSVQHEEKLS